MRKPPMSAAKSRMRAALAAAWAAALLLLSLPIHAQVFSHDGFEDGGYPWSRGWVDLNGDGKADYCDLYNWNADLLRCVMSNGAGFETSPLVFNVGATERGGDGYNWGVHWADVNGDGVPDFCRKENQAPQFSCRLGPDFSRQYQLSMAYVWPGFDFALLPHGRDLSMVDIDADGRQDVCFLREGEQIVCHLARDEGFTALPAIAYSAPQLKGHASRKGPRAYVDFNGDGYPDWCRLLDDSSVRCSMGSAAGFTGELSLPVVLVPYMEGANFIDFNGDGKADLCRLGNVVGGVNLICRLSTGIGWDSEELVSSALEPGDPKARFWVDINSDGIPDFCRQVGTSMKCRTGHGGAMPGTLAFAEMDFVVQNVEIGNADPARTFCDPVGKGVLTLCRSNDVIIEAYPCVEADHGVQVCPAPRVKTVAMVGLRPHVRPNGPLLVTALDAGIGMETRITYASLNDPDVYFRSGRGQYPRSLIVQSAQPVVKETRAWSTLGATNLTGVARYFYKDLRVDTWGGGLGFRERWMFTEGTNTLDRTVFFQGLGPAVDPSSRPNDPLETGLVQSSHRYAPGTPAQVPSDPGLSARQRKINALFLEARRPAPSPSLASRLTLGTQNLLSDALPAGDATASNPRFRYIGQSTIDRTELVASTAVPLSRTVTTSQQDDRGNVLSIREQTRDLVSGLEWEKLTTNTYSTDARWRRLGRLTQSTTVGTAPSIDAQLAAYPRSAGTSPNAQATGSPLPAPPTPFDPAWTTIVTQYLLED
jgi:hypothetical protein